MYVHVYMYVDIPLVSHGAGRTMAGDCASGVGKLVRFLAVICSGEGWQCTGRLHSPS